MKIHTVKTPEVKLAYERSGPAHGEPLLLVHGWPDSPRTWDKVLPALHAAGHNTVVPYLRGYGPSSFRDRLLGRNPRRTGQPVAFAQDMLHLADKLGMRRFHYIGHDWGARTAYALAAIGPDRLKRMVAISVPFQPGKAKPPALGQARAFWYQWFLNTVPGGTKFREDPVAFGRKQWDTWSPAGWYTEQEFAETAKAWHGDDFKDVVLHSYRSRWGGAPMDPRYAAAQAKLEATELLATPTLLIHGADDFCELPETAEHAGHFFSGEYRSVLLAGVGHFPQRENPEAVAAEILKHLG